MDHGTYDEHQDYSERQCSPEPDYLIALRRATHQKLIHPRMNSGWLQGRFLSMISKLVKPDRILELGTYSGYSALCLAEGLREGGEFISLEKNDELEPFHQRHLHVSDPGKRIQVIYGLAMDILPELKGSFDLIYLDADKENYLTYYPNLKTLLASGGLLLIDNMLWEGKVLSPVSEGDTQTEAIVGLTNIIKEDDEMEHVLLPLRDGLMLVRKR
ncbi:MAG: class I SAM-dependent methyltransferase [Bacteroidetes bacterium]|nr:class I SAM-dependent methyltransferase [Bacteroidota bacterium]